MKIVRIVQILIFCLILLALPVKRIRAFQQPSFPVSYSLNPSVLPVNSNVSTMACVSVVGPGNSITLQPTDFFIFFFDSSVGPVSLPQSPTTPILTTSSASPNVPNAATASDFSVFNGAANHNKLVFAYTPNQAKNLAYGTNICTQVNIATAGTPGPALVRVSSQLSTTANNLPSITATLVDFPTSKGSYSFMSAISIPSTSPFFAPLNGFGDPTGMNTGQGTVDGFGVAAAPMPAACTFDSLQVSATAIGGAQFPYVFTLWKNDQPTALTCGLTTSSGTDTVTCSDTTDAVSVAPGDLVATQVSQTGFIQGVSCCTPAGTFGISLHCK
ncbi:MAG TPA: hypothetical protein VFC63_21470 [Blastocatellia bacterium]|nr:hypothetical protein [Blastocatellia bacterium]